MFLFQLNSEEEDIKQYEGVVTFLDVLGWKGMHYTVKNPISSLLKVIKMGKDELNYKSSDPIFENIVIKIFIVSDTIVILSHMKDQVKSSKFNKMMQFLLHGNVAKMIIQRGILESILFRGATSYGAFSYDETNSIFMGKAIDEAAEWHENTDWCGLILAPHAQEEFEKVNEAYISRKNGFNYDINKLNNLWIQYEKIPFKGPKINLKYALNWIPDKGKSKYTNKLRDNMPYLKNVVSKYLNTLEYIDSFNSKQVSLTNDVIPF